MKSLPVIAQSLNIAVSTLRYRITPYRDFIPCESSSKGDRYSDESALIMKEISGYYDQKKTPEDIMLLLSTKYARDIEIIQEATIQTTNNQQPNFTELVRLNDNLEKMIERLDRQQEMQQQINEMRLAISEISRVGRHKNSWFKFW